MVKGISINHNKKHCAGEEAGFFSLKSQAVKYNLEFVIQSSLMFQTSVRIAQRFAFHPSTLQNTSCLS
jgi:hypothetical protein